MMPDLTMESYIDLALNHEAATKKSIVTGKIAFPIIMIIKKVLKKARG